MKTFDNQQAKFYSKQALSIALRMNSNEAMARAFLMMGIANFNYHNDSSFAYYSSALKIAEQFDLKKTKVKIYYAMAMVYRAAFDTKSSILFLDSSINLSQKLKNYTLLSDAYNVLGNIKYALLDTQYSRRWYDSAYNIASRHSLSKQMGVAMASLSRFEKDSIRSSELLRNAILILKKQPGNEEEIASILCNLGLKSSNPDTAIKYYQSSIGYARIANSVKIESSAYNDLAYSYMEKKNYLWAEQCLINNAIPLAEKFKNYDWLSTLYDSYTDVLISEKKIGPALIFSRKALHTRLVADKKQASDQIRLLTALLDVKNTEVKIKDDQRVIQEQKNKTKQTVFWLSIIILLLIILTFIILWKLQKNRIKHHKELLISANKLIESEENMKSRVSMELHDLVSPFYTLMSQQIEKARIKDPNMEKELKDRIANMSENIRKISHRMHNDFMDRETIGELVKGLCDDLQVTTSIPILYFIKKEEFHLTGEEKMHVYRITQELLTNAIKYVTFGEISIRLFEEEGRFFLLYKDTGPGFDEKTTNKKGLGIMNIFERTKIINGKAVLRTEQGKGTKWNISIPIKRVKTKRIRIKPSD
jgi:signal transduction histidine kinase